ncbi:hypothetical protein TSAR_000033 [Trichomalopsis sarcophagae]|uniref:Vitellogenin domain-containing protein n=1 Tax=Trichomalopsis sarcophagae TaxID=543379 RepID=A0A232F914_9HYME|nr:hypothetical protein TSAR_000033 [Trichomalopsis sarcophagae]
MLFLATYSSCSSLTGINDIILKIIPGDDVDTVYRGHQVPQRTFLLQYSCSATPKTPEERLSTNCVTNFHKTLGDDVDTVYLRIPANINLQKKWSENIKQHYNVEFKKFEAVIGSNVTNVLTHKKEVDVLECGSDNQNIFQVLQNQTCTFIKKYLIPISSNEVSLGESKTPKCRSMSVANNVQEYIDIRNQKIIYLLDFQQLNHTYVL